MSQEPGKVQQRDFWVWKSLDVESRWGVVAVNCHLVAFLVCHDVFDCMYLQLAKNVLDSRLSEIKQIGCWFFLFVTVSPSDGIVCDL